MLAIDWFCACFINRNDWMNFSDMGVFADLGP